MKFSVIIQARSGSSRLPNKILMKLQNKPVILHMIDRIKKCKYVNDIIICTTTNCEDDIVSELCDKNNVKCFRGSESNVLDRYYQAALLTDSDVIIRCTGDCPLIDPNIIDTIIQNFKTMNEKIYSVYYYDSNYGFPDGFDVEMFTFDALKEAKENARLDEEIEHVSPYIHKKYGNKTYKIQLTKEYQNLDLHNLHLSLDTELDYKILENIFDNVYTKNNNFTVNDVLEYLNNNHSILNNFQQQIDNFHGKGQQLYIEAKKIIPGGTQLLSKRPEMFLPDYWPAYYQKASGIEITTLDGVKMKDFSYMAIGACILGYKDPDVNREVHKAIDRGNMSTLNCPSEVTLTKLLIEVHPWADMARYTRSAGEACSVAIRIARAASKKDKVAFCGYHGWHDWYLASNWNNEDSLGNHLLTGLSPNGVPKNLKDTAFPFNYNKIDELLTIIENHDIGTIIMEPQRSTPPENNFLENVRKIASNKNIILIFDEVSSAFRINTGGIHLEYGVYPDIAIFGKSMSNGYPIGAVIGKQKYMNSAQDTFISSTFWTEDIGFISSIATINKHKKLQVGKHIKHIGNYFQSMLQKIAKNNELDITVSGLPAMTTFSFNYKNDTAIKTLFIQKMLERNILAKNTLYLSYAHKKEDIDFYLENINEVFNYLKQDIDNNLIEKKLLGNIAHNGFKRLA